ncbi:RES family NAD+ phosphorylase, partial [Klebsiella pneumoniae]|uniref:RES family NAD+ phosphorylase n=1 Tax=Klebsiella pneumoniae TaxID=573 RepID=UPI0028F9DC33
MMSLWDALRMNMMISYQELVRTFPKSAALDYIPSQYICEFIKKTGFHGVLYSSSVSEGINLALFDPLNATGGNVSIYDIDKVEVSVSKQD